MTWPPIIRVFFAIDFTPEVQDALHQVILSMKKSARKGHILWTRAENLHVTLKFLPTLNIENLPKLEMQVSSMLKKYRAPLPLHVGSCITFPFDFRPRIIAMEVIPMQLLQPIADEMTTICNELQLPQRDNNEFRPHITLGRVKHPKNVSLHDFLIDKLPTVPPINVDHITLFRSQPASAGAHHYTIIKRFPLG